MDPPDDLDDYLSGDSALSRQYRQESAPLPPHALDRRVLKRSREMPGKLPTLAPLAFAASVFLSVGLVLAMVFGPQTGKRVDDVPRLVRIAAHADAVPYIPLNRRLALYSSDPQRTRLPSNWLADIAAMRRAGRIAEADAQLRLFRHAYPNYSTRDAEIPP